MKRYHDTILFSPALLFLWLSRMSIVPGGGNEHQQGLCARGPASDISICLFLLLLREKKERNRNRTEERKREKRRRKTGPRKIKKNNKKLIIKTINSKNDVQAARERERGKGTIRSELANLQGVKNG